MHDEGNKSGDRKADDPLMPFVPFAEAAPLAGPGI